MLVGFFVLFFFLKNVSRETTPFGLVGVEEVFDSTIKLPEKDSHN